MEHDDLRDASRTRSDQKFLNDPDIPERNKDSVRGWFKEKYLDPSVQRVKENSERWKQNQTVERSILSIRIRYIEERKRTRQTKDIA